MFVEAVLVFDLALVLEFVVKDFLASTSSDPLDENNRVLLRPTSPGVGEGENDRAMLEAIEQRDSLSEIVQILLDRI